MLTINTNANKPSKGPTFPPRGHLGHGGRFPRLVDPCPDRALAMADDAGLRHDGPGFDRWADLQLTAALDAQEAVDKADGVTADAPSPGRSAPYDSSPDGEPGIVDVGSPDDE